MTIANIGNQVYAVSKSVYDLGVSATDSCGRAFTVLSKDAANTENVLTFTKAADAFIKAREVFGYGSPSQSEVALQTQVGYLEGWASLMTLPDAAIDTAKKVQEFISNGGYALALDCVGFVTGLLNASYEAASFLENQLMVPAFKGVSSMAESANFQALLVGATARTTIAAERVIAYALGKEVNLNNLIKNVLEVTKNGSDLAFAALKLTDGSAMALASASSVSAASKVAQYCFSKVA